jgi:PKHD-type hydroxylase
MADQSIWYYTDLPEDVVDIVERDLTEKFDTTMADSRLHGDALNKEKRNSQNTWIPSNHWVGGFLWSFVERANRENFLYDSY